MKSKKARTSKAKSQPRTEAREPSVPKLVVERDDPPKKVITSMRKMRAPSAAVSDDVLWNLTEKEIDGRLYKVLAGPSSDTLSATKQAWEKLLPEAHQVLALAQSRDWAISIVRRHFPAINEWCTDEEIQELLDAHDVSQKFGLHRWIARALSSRTGVPAGTLERNHRFNRKPSDQ